MFLETNKQFVEVEFENLWDKMNMNMMGTLDVPRGDIEPGTHTETTEVLLSLLSQNKALGGKKIQFINCLRYRY